METLVWDEELALGSQAYASKCPSKGDSNRGAAGENFVTFRIDANAGIETGDLVRLIQDWYDESEDVLWSLSSAGPVSKTYANPEASCKHYDPSTGACFIGHYTQIVWAQSNKIGCGASSCSEELMADTNETNETMVGEPSFMVFVCRYNSPKGNLFGYSSQVAIPPGAAMLPPFNVGLKCASCASMHGFVHGTCSVSGLCDVGSVPLRCYDPLSAKDPLIMQPDVYTSCSGLKAAWPDWCSRYEGVGAGYRRCPASCGHCSVPPGVGHWFCDTTTTTTNTTTTTAVTTPPTTTLGPTTTVTTTTRLCQWVCYSSFEEAPTDAPTFTTTTSTTTTTIALQIFSEGEEVIITGSLVLTVPDSYGKWGAEFGNDTEATGAVAAGIADALGVPIDYMALTIKPWSGAMRRLGSALTVEYIVTIPGSASGALKSAAVHRATTVTLAEMAAAVQKAVTAAKGPGYIVTVNSMTKPAVRTVARRPVRSSSRVPWRYLWWLSLAGCLLSLHA